MTEPTATNSKPKMVNTTSTTITVDVPDTVDQVQEETVQLKLRKPSGDRKVKWSSETVDNEHMQKKKSKCCCIYTKPRAFGESSSESDSDDNEDGRNCEHHGHKKKSEKVSETLPESIAESGDSSNKNE